MYTGTHTAPHPCFKMLFASTIVLYLLVSLSPLTCLEMPKVQTSVVPTPQPGQLSVDTSDTGESSTPSSHVPATQQGLQHPSELASPSTQEEAGTARAMGERTTGSFVGTSTTLTEQPSVAPSNRPLTGSYPEVGRTTPIPSSSGQPGGHDVTVPTFAPPKRTQPSDNTTITSTKTSTPTTRSRGAAESTESPQLQIFTLPMPFCSRTASISQNTEGTIQWNFDSGICIKEHRWMLSLPDGYGFVVEFHHVEMEITLVLDQRQIPF